MPVPRSTESVPQLEATFTNDGFTVDVSPTANLSDYSNVEIESHLFTRSAAHVRSSNTTQTPSESNTALPLWLYWFHRFDAQRYHTLFLLGFENKQEWFSPSMGYLYRISDLLLRRLSQQPDLELMREQEDLELLPEDIHTLLDSVPFANGSEFVDEAWLGLIWDQLLGEFRQEIKGYEGTTAAYFAEHNSHINVAGRIFFHLVEEKQEDYPFAFMATYSTKPSKNKKAIHTPLKHALMEYKKEQKKLLELLATVTRVSDHSAFIAALMESGELFSPLRFTAGEAYTFLQEIPLYEESGIMCRVPDWWRKHTNSIRLSISIGGKEPSKVGIDAMMDFTPQLLMDEEELSEQELRDFLNMADGLIQYKGRWVEINKEKLETALLALEQARSLAEDGQISLADAMRMQLNIDQVLPVTDLDTEVDFTNGQWLREMKSILTDPAKIPPVSQEPSFKAQLRPYQEQGYQWLNTMAQLGFGACLADDMGLGKTIQVIAYLEHYRVQQGGHGLLILPASLLGNWQTEISTFAPNMTYQILHRSETKANEHLQIDDAAFLCVTTYGMIPRLEELMDRTWDILIIDEAQAIKNAGTRQSRAVKSIKARIRIAMTGTPIENKLEDLWSLFDFLNKGLLGTSKEFSTFVKSLNTNELGYSRIRNVVSPFLLRRLKTDRRIISDLPDKVEMDEYAGLSKKQTLLYRKLVTDLEKKLLDSDGIERKGLVLASIMKFKQICNHPDQYLGQTEYKKDSSGKFLQLERICQTISQKRERVLVFTQFREITEPLAEFLETIFARKGFVLHGGTTVKQRSEMVTAFNGEAYIPFMVLSLKAGGVGLNLTAASHVIHFDRWWNPAVENQATDRAFRIGQTKNVFVHKFITKGTIEEKIDAMIAEKQKLAGDILSASGEQWITELNNDQLLDLFRLGGEEL